MSEPEMIPLSANIFHEKGNQQSRALAALDVMMNSWSFTGEAYEALQKIRETLLPAGYDVRAELGAALRGEDTDAPKAPEPGQGPTYCLLTNGLVAVFDAREKAEAFAAQVLQIGFGTKLVECRINQEQFR